MPLLGDAGYCDWRSAWSDSDHGCGDFAAFHLRHGACFWLVDDLRRLFGGVYGGSITAILLKIPGTPAAAATAIDGYELTKQGKAGLALSAATFSSFSGGTLSIIVLMFLSPVLASWALKFSASESFALATFGLSIIASISGESLIKGLIAGVGGLLIATIGLDPMGGFPRFTGGFVELMNVPFIPVMIGLFAASEAFRSMEQNQQIRQGRRWLSAVCYCPGKHYAASH